MLCLSGCTQKALCLQMEHLYRCYKVKEQPLREILCEVQKEKQAAKSLLSKALHTASFHTAESVNQGIAPRIFLH